MEKIILNIPWKYKEGDKIGYTDIIWNNSIIDKELETDRCKYLLDHGSYWIQFYPGDDSIMRHVVTDMDKVIAKILGINYDGIKIELNSRGYRSIPKDIYNKLVASPKMLHDGNKVIFIGNIYCI